MGRFIKGEGVVLPFPFTDLSATQKRPAVVVAPLLGDDVILCMITSKNVRDPYTVPLNQTDFVSGGLPHTSNIRPNRLFTADSNIILRSAGQLSPAKLDEVVKAIVKIVTA